MDSIDEYIRNIVTQKISEPENLDEIIMDAIASAKCKKKMRGGKIKKIILAVIITLICLGGIFIFMII